MVIRNPHGFLVMRKPFYPEGIWRLPTGGVEVGEGVEEALRRELMEETGLEVPHPRPLAHLEYLHPSRQSVVFETHLFLIETPDVAVPQPGDEVMEFRHAKDVSELRSQAEDLLSLGSGWSYELKENWEAWGWGRAIMQLTACDGLTKPEARNQPET